MSPRLNVFCESNMDNFRVTITKIGDRTSVVIEHCEEEEFDEDEFDEEERDPEVEPGEGSTSLNELIKRIMNESRRQREKSGMPYNESTAEDACDKDCLEDRDDNYDDDEEFV